MTQSDGGYHFMVGSDIVRDGMFMEMLDAGEACAAEVFYSDVSGKMVVTFIQQGLPIAAVEELLSRARRELPPRQQPEATTSASEPPPAKP